MRFTRPLLSDHRWLTNILDLGARRVQRSHHPSHKKIVPCVQSTESNEPSEDLNIGRA